MHKYCHNNVSANKTNSNAQTCKQGMSVYLLFLVTAIAFLNIISVPRCLPKEQLHVNFPISTGYFCEFVHNKNCKFGEFL
jgi:hypothetical protein